MEKAIVLTHGFLNTVNAKTCHGLLRHTSRYDIVGVVDSKFVGQDAGSVMDGIERNIPIYASVLEAIEAVDDVKNLIIGVATHGGLMPESFKSEVKDAITNGCHVINGLHDYINDMPGLPAQAKEHGVELIDIRRPKSIADLHFWQGDIYMVDCPIIAVLGVDCALGKRTTAGLLHAMCNERQLKTEMIYTGQTGWLQGYKHGFIFDSTLNDFISGEIEKSIVNCFIQEKPELIIIEGQSALRNPSGPGGSEFLLSGNAKGVVLQVSPERIYFEGYEDLKILIPSTRNEIQLINQYGAEVIAIAVAHGNELKREELRNIMIVMERELELPVVAPLIDGVEELYRPIKEYIHRFKGQSPT
jgi:uncharacterized NAD-dependent epimerase/dehydratase family protein